MAQEEYPIGNNILQYVDFCIKSGVSDSNAYMTSASQANCVVSKTNGYIRIYCPPDCQPAANGGSNNMWGGFVLGGSSYTTAAPQAFTSHLELSHTYIILMDVKGYSDRAFTYYFTNNTGWGGGGLNPSPSNVSVSNPISAGFNSNEWKTFWYKCTINDAIYKTCTSSYSSYVQGETYLSYRHFAYGPLAYSYTGTNGTDIYLTNFRMYDITNNPFFSIEKTGVHNDLHFNENENLGSVDPASDFRYGEFRSNHFYEL